MVGVGAVDESRRLLTEDLLLEVAVEEGVGHVHLVHRPGARDRKLKNGTDRPGIDNRVFSPSNRGFHPQMSHCLLLDAGEYKLAKDMDYLDIFGSSFILKKIGKCLPNNQLPEIGRAHV